MEETKHSKGNQFIKMSAFYIADFLVDALVFLLIFVFFVLFGYLFGVYVGLPLAIIAYAVVYYFYRKKRAAIKLYLKHQKALSH